MLRVTLAAQPEGQSLVHSRGMDFQLNEVPESNLLEILWGGSREGWLWDNDDNNNNDNHNNKS